MDSNERKGWLEVITPEELDKHMANIGQAHVNAGLVKQMFQEYPLRGTRLLIPGCGTGQMFDYIVPADLGPQTQLTLTDINTNFLVQTERRLRKFPAPKYRLEVDNVEETKLRGKYDGVLAILVFHHVDWKKSLDSLLTLHPEQFYIIEQEQDTSKPAVTRERDLPASIRSYSDFANPSLIPRNELIGRMKHLGYNLRKVYEKQVPDNKTMVGFVFER
jgi:hypothetical protein